jgi:RNA polymerase sigma-70 factor, ECF subfamily
MESTELQAIEACQRGERAAFGVLYDVYLTQVYRFLYYKTLHRETTEDLTSQTFMKAMEHIQEYDAAKGKFSSWLYRIAQNTFIDHYRARKITVSLDQVFELAAKESLTSEMEAKYDLVRVQAYLASLDIEARDLIQMRVWQGLSYAEISDITGKNEGAVKMAFSRALKQLKSQVPLTVLVLLAVFLR